MTKIIRGLPFGDYCEIDAINNSGLKLIRQSPMHYKLAKRKETKALVVGHASHTATLEPHLFNDLYCVFSEGQTKTTKEGKKEWSELESTGKTILRHAEYVDAMSIANAVRNYSPAAQYIKNGNAELTIVTELDDLTVKCRYDYLIASSSIVDLKTTENASPESFIRSITNYGYDMQAAFYIDCGRAAGLEIDGFIFIAVESAHPYAVGIYQLDDESIEIGRQKYQAALERYRECEAFDDWPGYSPELLTLTLPNWARK